MSKKPTIPDDVRRFLLTSVPSVPYLEAALFFRRQPALRHKPIEVARALYIQPRAAGELLGWLCDAGVLARDGAEFWYAANESLDGALGRLAALYSSNLIEVTQLIHDATQQHAERFADAFRWKKET